jgi:hypothetical protein
LANGSGPYLWFLNIDTLKNPTPDLSTIKVDKWMDAGVWGPDDISHQIYDPTGGYLMVSTYSRVNSQGGLRFLNADTNVVEKSILLPPSAHSLAFPGQNR